MSAGQRFLTWLESSQPALLTPVHLVFGRSIGSAAFRTVTLAQLGTIALTWDLWKQRTTPPLLPVFEGLPGTSLGWPLVLTLLVALAAPRSGTIAHLLILTYAILADQTRLQPEFVSMALLLGSIEFEMARFVGRAHLVTLWVWSGLHKLLSTGFGPGTATWLSGWLNMPVASVRWVLPAAEVLLGIMALTRRTHRIAIPMAFSLHGTILLVLLWHNWNPAVWLWNVALPAAAAFLLADSIGPKSAGVFRKPPGTTRVSVITAVIWLVAWVYPAGFYLGLSDAYLSHNLYSGNEQRALVCALNQDNETACFDISRNTYETLNVPLPPESHLFRAWFVNSCKPGESLYILPVQTVFNDEGSSPTRPSLPFPCHRAPG